VGDILSRVPLESSRLSVQNVWMLPDFPALKLELRKVILAGLAKRIHTGDPVLAEIKHFRQNEGTLMRYEQQGGKTVEEGFEKMGAEFTILPEEVPDLVGQKLNVKLEEIAQKMIEITAKSFFKKMGEITQAAGTSIDAGGKPVSPEMMLDMMARVQMEFDTDGKPAQSIVVHPDMVPALQKVSEQIENDPDLKRRQDEILQRQREAWVTRESNRKLVD